MPPSIKLPPNLVPPAPLPPAPPAGRPDSSPSSVPDTDYEEPAYAEPVYEEPRYDDSNRVYEQDYCGGYEYDSPGEYYPGPSDDYYQEPEYQAPAQQPIRGVEGSLLDQQQFEFQQLEELSSSSPQAGTAEQESHEPGQVLVATVSMDEAKKLQQAVASAGYRPKSRTNLSQLGFVLTIFRLPAGVSVLDAVGQLKEAFPGFLVSANTRYSPLAVSGDKKNYAKPLIQWGSSSAQCGNKVKIGLLDTNVDSSHNHLAAANIKTSTVLPAGLGSKNTDHGTAIANLLVGSKQGLLPGAELFAVDVFRKTNDKLDTTTA